MARLTAILTFLVSLYLVAGCEASQKACQVIHAADTVCSVIEYVGVDGKVHQVPVSSEELQGLARTAAARQIADAGSK